MVAKLWSFLYRYAKEVYLYMYVVDAAKLLIDKENRLTVLPHGDSDRVDSRCLLFPNPGHSITLVLTLIPITKIFYSYCDTSITYLTCQAQK